MMRAAAAKDDTHFAAVKYFTLRAAMRHIDDINAISHGMRCFTPLLMRREARHFIARASQVSNATLL